jgi:ferredoxin-thioredoxin reductase catalytic chain
MALIEINPEDVVATYHVLQKEAKDGGYQLNPDPEFTRNLVAGLMKNEQRYGYRACPCRLASGTRELDLDIICPCDYRDPDLSEFDACYCALYVSDDIAKGKKTPGPVPERRPPRFQRRTPAVAHTIPLSTVTGPVLAFPVWRCKVCGYLCARDQPPGICPICKVTKDRFERFM